MSIETFSFFESETGHFVGRRFTGPIEFVEANTPIGCAAMAGAFDHLRQCVDLASMAVVDWQPPAPANDEWQTWQWNDVERRWLAAPTVAATARDARARRIDLLSACDWVVTQAIERGQPIGENWLAYRQSLRDVPAQPGFPSEIDWPSQPATGG